MIANDQPFGPQKNKIDHSIPPLERRNTKNTHQIKRKLRGSHAQSQDATAQKNLDTTLLLQQIAAKKLQVFTQRGKFSLNYSLLHGFFLFSHEFFPIFLILIRNLFYHLDCMA